MKKLLEYNPENTSAVEIIEEAEKLKISKNNL